MAIEKLGILVAGTPPTLGLSPPAQPMPLRPVSTLKSQISNAKPRPIALSSIAPNKANYPRFQPKNEGPREKQTQTNPIAEAPLSGAQRSRIDLAGVPKAAQRTLLPSAPSQVSNLRSQISDGKRRPTALSSSAPNKANLPRFWPGNAGAVGKQSQLSGRTIVVPRDWTWGLPPWQGLGRLPRPKKETVRSV